LQLHRYLIATYHYARGISHAVLGDTVRAAEELALLLECTAKVPADHVLHNNLCSDMLAIAEYMLRGELLYREGTAYVRCLCVLYVRHSHLCPVSFCYCYAGKYDDGFWELNMAADLSDNLVYDEPWGWMQPPLHALGALTLEQVPIPVCALLSTAGLFVAHCSSDDWILM
jgi:hypothetical protein